MRRMLCLLWLAATLGFSGCASPPRTEVKQIAIRSGEANLWESVRAAEVIYVGEVHDDQSNHEYELQLVRGALAQHLKVAVGWEMFTRSQQPLLDLFEHHKISLEQLLTQTGFQASWGIYSPIYAKILAVTAKARMRNVGLNASNPLVHRVAMGETLSQEERNQLPEGYVVDSRAYENFVRLMGDHPGVTEADLHRYFDAQNVWDQTMADSILAFRQQNPNTKLIVLTGRGHIQNGFGIPSYVAQKSKLRQLLLFPPTKNSVPNHEGEQ